MRVLPEFSPPSISLHLVLVLLWELGFTFLLGRWFKMLSMMPKTATNGQTNSGVGIYVLAGEVI